MNNKLPKYDKYKPSGVEWLGEIPEHWEVKRLKESCKAFGRIGFRGYTTADLVDENQGAITISPSNINEERMLFEKCTYLSWAKYKQSPEIMVFNEDIIIVKTGSTFGKIGFINNLEKEATINPQLLVLKQIKISNKFLFYQLKTPVIQIQINQEVVGSTIPTISESKILNFITIVPPLIEQTRIAEFLDRKTAQIDQAIGIKEKQIALLKERRQLMIHRAVTRGTNPDIKLKPSGVEWIGDIPEHWIVSKMRNYATVNNGTTPSRDIERYWNDGNIAWVASGKVNDLIINEPSEYITEKALRECSLKIFPIGTVLLGIVGQGKTRGTSALLNIPATINQNLAGIVPDEKLDSKFLHNFLIISYSEVRRGNGSNQEALNCQLVSSFKILIPPIEEQKQIVTHIETLSSKIATAISLKEQEIAKLKEYKSVLINGAVTGKVKVG